MHDRTVPYDLDAERATLGALLLERDAVLAVSDTLYPDDFYLEKHALIYQAILDCLAERVPPDLATVAAVLRRHDQLTTVGGLSFLSELIMAVPTAVHIDYYAANVVRAATLRRLIASGSQIALLGYREQQDLDETLDAAEQELFRVTQRRRGADFVPLREVVQTYFERTQRNEEEVVVPTGISGLDAKLNGGLRAGQLLILAARPGMGKTGMALSMAYHVGVVTRQQVGVVSLEMNRDELLQRLVAIHTGIDSREVGRRARQGDVRVLDAFGLLSGAPIAVEDQAVQSVADVRSKARRLALEGGLGLLIVDYLQLLIGGGSGQSRVDAVSMISRQLKLLAREVGCPVVALSQLSRAVEQRASKVPQLSDLRESGSLEQDADVVVFIYREEGQEGGGKGVELHIAKQRNGPVGVVAVGFEPTTTRFSSVQPR